MKFLYRREILALSLALLISGSLFASQGLASTPRPLTIQEKLGFHDHMQVWAFKAGHTTPDQKMLDAGWKVATISATGIEYYTESGSDVVKRTSPLTTKLILIPRAEALVTDGGMNRTACRMFNYNSSGSCASEATGTASYIAVTTNAGAPAYTDTACTGEETTNGLQRARGVVNIGTAASGDIATIITNVFAVTGTFTAEQKACLWTSTVANNAMLYAINTFSSVNLISGDSLTIKWTVNHTN